MTFPLPRLATDLTLRLGCAAVTLSPRQGLHLAEELIRKSTRRMMVEEAFVAPQPRRSPAASSQKAMPPRRHRHLRRGDPLAPAARSAKGMAAG
jgi:hypothetical protein